jgi:bifunctional UDP-N-acetylglucosamine pyrophosphorylase / glucosamine-1-phosphate N-acetyltransferase
MDPIAVLVLAAGLGKRMGQGCPKVIATTRSKSLIEHVLESASKLSPQQRIVVVGHKRELVEDVVLAGSEAGAFPPGVQFAFQSEQLGTGHAVQTALPLLGGFSGTVLILYGDVPLIRHQTLSALIELHAQSRATLSLVCLKGHRDNSYGRIIRDRHGRVQRIVELKDCSSEQREIDETNPGIYAVDSAFLAPAVGALRRDNAQAEYYLTDIIERAVLEGQTVSSLTVYDAAEMQGVNTPADLYLVNRTIMERKVRELIEAGVVVADAATLYVDDEVQIAPGAKLGPNVTLRGKTSIAAGVTLEGSACLIDTFVDEEALIRFCVRSESAVIGKKATVGPFAHLRPGAILEEEVRVGNFVEVKQSRLKRGAKASHLTYLGDSTVGAHANIGAGTITCNYDGYRKYETVIGEGAFIGSNSALVAPVKVGDGATVGAGSVITKDVEGDSLALTRAPQTGNPGWSKRKREQMGSSHGH